MADPTEKLIQEIVAKHGVAVGRDDPILILQTINFRLLQDSAKAQQAMLDQYKQEMEKLMLRWDNEAKARAEKILNASLVASKNAMAQLMQEGVKEMAASVGAEINTALSRVATPIRNARKIATLNVVASCITCLAAAVALWATRH